MPAACFKSVTLSGGSHATNCIAHNDRSKPPGYLLPVSERGRTHGAGVVISPDELLAMVTANNDKFDRKIHSNTKLFREAVILIDKETDDADIDNCFKQLKSQLGMTMLWHFEHNDEGHIDMDGITRKNHHIHFGYTFYNVETHRSHPNNANVMRKAQDIVSETLKLQRGVSKRESGRTGMSHQQYRRAKKEAKQQNQAKDDQLAIDKERQQAEIDRLAQENRALRERLKATEHAHHRDYQALNRIKKSEADLKQKLTEMTAVVERVEERAKTAETQNEIDEITIDRYANTIHSYEKELTELKSKSEPEPEPEPTYSRGRR